MLLYVVVLGFVAALANAQQETVQLTRSCVARGQDLVIQFRNDVNPRDDDWVGVYHHTGLDPMNEPLIWHYTCGNQDCFRATAQGTVRFSTSDGLDFWPLPRGTYHAVLSRESDVGMSYQFLDISEGFRVELNLTDCRPMSLPVPPITVPTPPVPAPTSRAPVPAPTTRAPVTSNPVPNATPRPTPTSPPTIATGTRMSQIIQSAKLDILALIAGNRFLPGQYLRQVFHDCVGGVCDGCINTNNIDNGGLSSSMNSIRTIERKYANDLSRADLWVLASFVSVEHTMPSPGTGDRVEMPFHFYGRQDCGEPRNQGPDPILCSPNLGTSEVLDYMAQEFNFNERETAAIMGSHTIGAARRTILGFNGPNGWVPNNTLFDNEYYTELVGPGPRRMDQFEGAPQWRQVMVNNTAFNNTNGPPLPSRWQWEGFPGGKRVIMLNSDVAMVRELNDGNKREDGFVSCKFVTRAPGNNVCPMARESLFSHMVRFRNDNLAFLIEFRDAMVKMTNVGYRIDETSCDADGNCRLVRIPPNPTTNRPNATRGRR